MWIGDTVGQHDIVKCTFANSWEENTALLEPTVIIVIVNIIDVSAIQRCYIIEISKWTTDPWEFRCTYESIISYWQIVTEMLLEKIVSQIAWIDDISILEEKRKYFTSILILFLTFAVINAIISRQMTLMIVVVDDENMYIIDLRNMFSLPYKKRIKYEKILWQRPTCSIVFIELKYNS